jgi:signal transduction histidine kinase
MFLVLAVSDPVHKFSFAKTKLTRRIGLRNLWVTSEFFGGALLVNKAPGPFYLH